MKCYPKSSCKLFILFACILAVILFVFLVEKEEASRFLGLKQITSQDRDRMIATRKEETENDLAEKLYFNKDEIVKDNNNVYYLPLSLENEWETGKITGETEDSNICIIMDEKRKEKGEYQADGDRLKLLIYNDKSYQEVSLVITALPIMSISFTECPSEVTLEEEEFFCEFDFYAPKQDMEKKVESVSTHCKVHKRGGSTKDFEKSGLKVELVDKNGQKEEKNLCNMRDDDDWILIPMYVEESKIRDKFCIDLWREISSVEAENNTGTQMEYVELILNGNYYGLFGLAVPVDRKQTDLSEKGEGGDLLFRLDGTTSMDLDALSYAGEMTEAGGVSVEFPKQMNQQKWDAIRDFLHLVYYEEDEVFAQKIQSIVEFDNMADLYLFLNLIYGKDNTVKNMYYCMRLNEDGTYKVSLIPWDMDLSLGTLYDQSNSNGLYWTYESAENLEKRECACYLTKRLRELNAGNFENILKERYKELRQDILTEENLFERIENLSDVIIDSGALARDKEKWQESRHNTDYSRMRAALSKRLIYLSDLE